MRKHAVSAVVIAGSLAAMAAAQSGARVTLPPNGWQSTQAPFVNHCQDVESYRVSTDPPAEWLRFEPATVNAPSGTAFGVQITARAGKHALGKYTTSLRAICISCAVTNSPCLQPAQAFPVEMTVANVGIAGAFEPILDTPSRAAAVTRSTIPMPKVYVPPAPAAPAINKYIPAIGGTLLFLAAIGMLVGLRALGSGRKVHLVSGSMGAESERHQVRR